MIRRPVACNRTLAGVIVKILVLMVVLLSKQASGFDFKAGLEAYNRGDFATALKEWQPIAEAATRTRNTTSGMLYARGQGVPKTTGRPPSGIERPPNRVSPPRNITSG